jgi:hypothetical protein
MRAVRLNDSRATRDYETRRDKYDLPPAGAWADLLPAASACAIWRSPSEDPLRRCGPLIPVALGLAALVEAAVDVKEVGNLGELMGRQLR